MSWIELLIAAGWLAAVAVLSGIVWFRLERAHRLAGGAVSRWFDAAWLIAAAVNVVSIILFAVSLVAAAITFGQIR